MVRTLSTGASPMPAKLCACCGKTFSRSNELEDFCRPCDLRISADLETIELLEERDQREFNARTTADIARDIRFALMA